MLVWINTPHKNWFIIIVILYAANLFIVFCGSFIIRTFDIYMYFYCFNFLYFLSALLYNFPLPFLFTTSSSSSPSCSFCIGGIFTIVSCSLSWNWRNRILVGKNTQSVLFVTWYFPHQNDGHPKIMNSNMTSHPTVSLWQESLSTVLRALPAGTFISCFYLCFYFILFFWLIMVKFVF